MRRFWYCLVLFLICSPVLHAQDGDLEITVHSGWSFLDVEREEPICIFCRSVPFYSTSTSADSSPVFGVKTGYYLNDHAEVEGRFAIAPGHKVITDNSFICPPGMICPAISDLYYPFYYAERNMVAYEYGGDFIYHLSSGRVRPFGKFGIGGVSSDVDQDVRHDFAFQFGGGAKFDLGRVGLRLELVDQVIPNYFLTEKTEHNLQVQYGFTFGLGNK